MQAEITGEFSWHGATPCKRVTETPMLNLLAFGEERRKARFPLVVVYSTANRANILDFHPKLSVIKQVLHAGLSVYIIEWKVPPTGDLGLADYSKDAIREVVDFVRRRSGAEAVHLFGYCWGGIFASIYTALHPDTVASLTLLATPIDLEAEPLSTVELWVRHSKVNTDRLVDEDGLVSGDVVRRAIMWSNPVQLFVAKWYELLDCSHDVNLVRAFFQGQRWAYDAPPIAGKLFGEVIRHIYQKNELARGELKIRGTMVRLSDITCPVLSVVGEQDTSVSHVGSLRIGELVSTNPSLIHNFRVPTGHLGLCVSVKSHTGAWPQVAHLLAGM
jgi:polyhydroxyalkanoate synthase subunit PhaC